MNPMLREVEQEEEEASTPCLEAEDMVGDSEEPEDTILEEEDMVMVVVGEEDSQEEEEADSEGSVVVEDTVDTADTVVVIGQTINIKPIVSGFICMRNFSALFTYLSFHLFISIFTNFFSRNFIQNKLNCNLLVVLRTNQFLSHEDKK